MPKPKKNKPEDLNFQMEFYEAILKENPDFVEALTALGEIYTKKSFHQKGLKVDLRLARLRPENPIVHYNLACSLSLLGDLGASFEAIRRAVKLGYDDFAFMVEDPDLNNLRRDERFWGLVNRRPKKGKTKKIP